MRFYETPNHHLPCMYHQGVVGLHSRTIYVADLSGLTKSRPRCCVKMRWLSWDFFWIVSVLIAKN
jgi:hypothetical protein